MIDSRVLFFAHDLSNILLYLIISILWWLHWICVRACVYVSAWTRACTTLPVSPLSVALQERGAVTRTRKYLYQTPLTCGLRTPFLVFLSNKLRSTKNNPRVKFPSENVSQTRIFRTINIIRVRVNFLSHTLLDVVVLYYYYLYVIYAYVYCIYMYICIVCTLFTQWSWIMISVLYSRDDTNLRDSQQYLCVFGTGRLYTTLDAINVCNNLPTMILYRRGVVYNIVFLWDQQNMSCLFYSIGFHIRFYFPTSFPANLCL